METLNLRVSEIFTSIDGEGLHAGGFSTFIRLFGCNLRCSYCDSRYACEGEDFRVMTVSAVLCAVFKSGIPHVTITGGEPLLQAAPVASLVRSLSEGGVSVCIETNGCVPIPGELLASDASLCMDVKSPSSGEFSRNILGNLSLLRPCDCLKLVLSDEDSAWAQSFLKTLRVSCPVYLSPVAGSCEPRKLVELAKSILPAIPQELAKGLRIQVQLHKILWPSVERGV